MKTEQGITGSYGFQALEIKRVYPLKFAYVIQLARSTIRTTISTTPSNIDNHNDTEPSKM